METSLGEALEKRREVEGLEEEELLRDGR